LHGSYQAIEFGDVAEALKDLTGSATQTFEIKNELDEQQWKLIQTFSNEDCLMGCAIETESKIEESGLLVNHAYS